VNDCAPEFPHNYSLELEDITAPGTNILSVLATDCDEDPANKNISYTLHGNKNGWFSVDMSLI